MNIDLKKILKIVFLSVFLIFIITYTFFRSKDLILGVKIIDVNIINGTSVQTAVFRQNDFVGVKLESNGKATDSIIHITGNAKNAVELTLNGRIISINLKGDFSETIALLSGYNIISIKAKDKFGNNDEKNYKLIY